MAVDEARRLDCITCMYRKSCSRIIRTLNSSAEAGMAKRRCMFDRFLVVQNNQVLVSIIQREKTSLMKTQCGSVTLN